MKRTKPGWPIWQLVVFAIAFAIGSLGGCATVEAPAEEPIIEEPAEEPVIEEPVAAIPVDRAGRPMFDEEGNSLSIDERIAAAEERDKRLTEIKEELDAIADKEE